MGLGDRPNPSHTFGDRQFPRGMPLGRLFAWHVAWHTTRYSGGSFQWCLGPDWIKVSHAGTVPITPTNVLTAYLNNAESLQRERNRNRGVGAATSLGTAAGTETMSRINSGAAMRGEQSWHRYRDPVGQ
jgi:hypothetical protein